MPKIYWLIWFFTSPVFAFAQGISVSPTRLTFTNDTQKNTQSLTFRNDSQEAITLRALVADFYRDSVGEKKYVEPGSLKNSNAKWLKFSNENILIPAGESKTITVELNIPPNTHPKEVSNSIVFFRTVKTQQPITDKNAGLGLGVLFEIGIQIYHLPDGLVAGDIEILNFKSDQNQNQKKLVLSLKNEGALNKDIEVKFELTEINSGKEIKLESRHIAMLPHTNQLVYLNLPNDLSGNYLAIAIIDAGNQYDLKVAEKEIKL